ncbi:MAG: YMGG-like glycine zipper-containing protein [Acidobacteriota bacterium]|nr:YMGG-like glycine zipper-containing protein [Acidobacteriota bacterium]
MNGFRRIFSIYSIIGLIVFGFAAQANAQGARSEKEVRRIVRNLNAKIEDFGYRLSYQRNQNSSRNQNIGNLDNSLRTLQDRMRDFETKLNSYHENSADVSNVLNAAKDVNDAVKLNRLGSREQNDWASIRAQFEQLASNYNVNWRWDGNNSGNNDYDYPNDANNNRYPPENRLPNNYPPNSSSALTGTYRLDASRSENTDEIADRAVDNSNARNNAQARQDLQNKLEAPEQITVDVRGNQVTLSSSRAAPVTFAADGRDRTEQTTDGRTLRVRSTLRGQELTVSSVGGDTDYTVVFASIDNGKAMKVTRRITTDYLNQTVFVESVYEKTDASAQLGTGDSSDNSNGSYSSNDTSDSNYPNNSTNNYPTPVNGRTGNFVVPNGTILTGTLQADVSTKVSQNNDRFRMTVNAPNEFRGAIVEGHIAGLNRSGKVSGRSQITFNFETIRLANGQTYDFAGFLQNVTDANGKTVKVDAEGTAKGDSQTNETVKRGGIGAGIGAIIGAIAGGGHGAAIGAVIGGSAGAGSVYVQGKDDLELKRGSSITVQSSSPIR